MYSIDTSEAIIFYLSEHDLLMPGETPPVTYMDGGVSGVVALVDTRQRLLLVKQALAKLKVKADWKCDVRRIEVEHEALCLYASIVADCVPKPIMYDRENCIMIREAAPAYCDTWKKDLLQGRINHAIAEKAISSLAAVHQHTAVNHDAFNYFNDQTFFDELRIKPYILHLLNKYPELTKQAEEQVSMLRENCIALIHGDYSPKNIIVDVDRIYIVDMEVACYSHPAFDLAFFMNHFFLKSIHMHEYKEEFLKTIRIMMNRYLSIATYCSSSDIESATVHLLGFMLLARIDGKSPVEYIVSDNEKQHVRNLGLTILHDGLTTIDQVIDSIK